MAAFSNLSSIWQDVRFGARMLRKSPGFTAMAVLTLALGIGANATVFSWIHTIVLDPIPGASEPFQLVVVAPDYRGTIGSSALSYPDFEDLVHLKDVFAGVLGSHQTSVLLTVGGTTHWVHGQLATANIFDVLGIQPQLGRGFVQEEDQGEGGHPVLVISYSLWRDLFDGDPHVIGRTVLLNQQVFTIIGVTPESFTGTGGGVRTDFWAPLVMHNEVLQYGSFFSRTFRWVTLEARLRPGISRSQAQAAVSAVASRLGSVYPDTNKDVTFRVFAIRDSPFGGQAKFLPLLRILMAVTLGVLLIVAVNVANLLLARATSREKEMALRVTLGASSMRVARQLLTESLLLALVGGTAGVLLAAAAVPLFSWFSARTYDPYGFSYDFRLDMPTVAFAAALTLITTTVFGTVPAMQLSRRDLEKSLREAAYGLGGGSRQMRIRNALVISQIALALILLVSAGLCLQGYRRASGIDIGFNPKNVLTAEVNLVPNRYSVERGRVFDRQLRERLAALPEVRAVALSTTLPLGSRNIFTGVVDINGYAASSSEDRQVSFNIISPGYFDAMGIPVIDGRDLTDQDDASARNVVVIDEFMAQRFWPGLNPLGREFRLTAGIAPSESFTVAGVVKSGKYRSLSEPPTPMVYMSYLQRPIASLFMGVVVRTRGDSRLISPLLRREIHALDPFVEPLGILTLEAYIQPAFSQARAAAQFLVALSALALVLACLGLYGVMAFVVNRRTHEIGIRVALGAQRSDVSRMVLAQGARLAFLGVAIGTLSASGFTRLLSGFLYGVSATDAPTFVVVPVLLVLIALAACYIPARRAMRVDPVLALHRE